MSGDAMPKEQLLQALADAYESLVAAATAAERRGVTRGPDGWGPREIVAHLAGWEVMATVRVPRIAAGLAPMELADEAQQTVMDDAINAAFVALAENQPVEVLCAILRRAYRRDIEILETLDGRFFRPGEYVYERTQGIVEHCHEHAQQLGSGQP